MQAAQNGAAPALAGAAATPTRTITLGDREVTLERVSSRKASRALALIRALTKATPALNTELAAFRRTYEAENVILLDRVQARLRFPPRPLVDENGDPVYHDGELVMGASPVDRMTEEDWENAGGVYRMPASPSAQEEILAVFDKALELAEEHVYKLLALFLMPNADVKRAWRAGTIDSELAERADDLLDESFGDELLELAVACGELVDTQFVAKARSLGGRLGNLGRLVGWDPPTTTATPTAGPSAPAESPDGPTTSTPTSSTASPAPTPDGPPTPSSTSPGTSPTPSSNEPSATESSSEQNATSKPQEAAPV